MSTTIAGGWNGVFVFAIIVARFLVTLAGTQGIRFAAALPAVFLGSTLGSVLAFTTPHTFVRCREFPAPI